MTAPALDAALTYATRGWRVCPIRPGTKHPAVERWQDVATCDHELIEQWWQQWPTHGVGIATGEASGVFVLDVDAADGKVGYETLHHLEAVHGPLPDTVEAITPTGGRHLYYRHPAGLELNNSAGRLGPDLDIRANGGQVLAAPSIHPTTGTPYAWDLEHHPADMPVADAPPWLLHLLKTQPKIEVDRSGPRPTFEQATLARDRYDLHPGAGDQIAAMLTDHGWTEGRQGRDGTRYLTRPGKGGGISATLGKVAPGVLYVFTGSAPPFEAERAYDASQVFALLHHHGDRQAADQALVELGWGVSMHGTDLTVLGPADTPTVDDVGPVPDEFFVDWDALFTRELTGEEWLLEPILARGRAHVIYAPHKVGKSLLSLWAALKIATGPDPVVVIYLDYEMGEDDLQERVDDMGYGPSDDLTRLRYALLPSLPPLDTPAGGDAIVAIVDEVQTAWPDHHLVVIIDTTGRAVEGEENSADTIRAFYRETGIRLKQRKCTWLRLDHAGKDKGKGQRGSSAKGDDVDLVWLVEQTEGKGLKLTRNAARMGWVPETVTLARSEEPLRYTVTNGAGWPAGTAEKAEEMLRAGVTTGMSANAAVQHYRKANGTGSNTLLKAAAKFIRTGGVIPEVTVISQENGAGKPAW